MSRDTYSRHIRREAALAWLASRHFRLSLLRAVVRSSRDGVANTGIHLVQMIDFAPYDETPLPLREARPALPAHTGEVQDCRDLCIAVLRRRKPSMSQPSTTRLFVTKSAWSALVRVQRGELSTYYIFIGALPTQLQALKPNSAACTHQALVESSGAGLADGHSSIERG